MFYSIAEEYIMKTKNMKIWDYLNMRQDHWSRIKKDNKLTLSHYKKLSEACSYHICDDHEELSKRMVETFPWSNNNG